MHLRGNLMLLLAAFIWGTTFVAQMVGMDGLGPFTYAAARYLLGFLFLVGLWYAWRGSARGRSVRALIARAGRPDSVRAASC